jgi:hypothetical protein
VTRRISILFPDPWRLKKHLKRRVVTPALVADIAGVVDSGCEVIIASDWLRLAKSMFRCFHRDARWRIDGGEVMQATTDVPAAAAAAPTAAAAAAADGDGIGVASESVDDNSGDSRSTLVVEESQDESDSDDIEYRWLARSPLPVPTERERVCETMWRPVYWARFVRI